MPQGDHFTPESAVTGGLISGVIKKRRKVLLSLPPTERNALAYKVYQKLNLAGMKSGRSIIQPGLNEHSFASTPIGPNSFRGGYNTLLWELLLATDEVLLEQLK